MSRFEDDNIRGDLDSAIEAFEKADPPAPAAGQPTDQPTDQPADQSAEKTEAAGTTGTTGTAGTAPAKAEGQPPTEQKTEATTAPAAPTESEVEPVPRSWRPAVREKWAKLDPEVRQEVIRRENEMLRSFGESGQARAIAKSFQETVAPYMARIQSTGMDPMKAVQQLLIADNKLTTSAPHQKAAYMAQLIKEYGVDIQALDSALAGEAIDPVAQRVEQLLGQRLAPIQQLLQNQQYMLEQQRMATQQEAAQTVEAMEANTSKYPHFDAVREDMADLIEMSARRGNILSLEDAYARAVGMNPTLAAKQQVALAQQGAVAQAQAQAAQAQKAREASASVRGAPAGVPLGALSENASLRDTIEAALSQAGGR